MEHKRSNRGDGVSGRDVRFRKGPLGAGIVLFAILGLLPLAAAAEEPSLKVEANRQQIYIGESFILQLHVGGASSAAEPDFSRLKKCAIKRLGIQPVNNFSISIINGRMTREGFSGVILSYEITPESAGVFQAGPVSVTVGGQRLTVEGPSVTVTDLEKQDRVALSVIPSRDTVLVDEPFEVTFILRMKRLPGPYAEADPLFADNPPVLSIPWLSLDEKSGLSGPDIRKLLNDHLVSQRQSPGFAINDFTLAGGPFDFDSLFNLSPQKRQAKFLFPRQLCVSNNAACFEYRLTLAYQPKDEGNYVFGPVVFKGEVPVDINAQGQARGARVFAVGPAATVRVIPPPDEGRPVSYSGAMGRNLAVTATLDTAVCNVGDPVTLTLTVSGPVRMDKVMPPKLSLQTAVTQRFTAYDNTAQTIRAPDRCQFIYTLRPLQAGTNELPPIDVSYYDVEARAYRTLSTARLPLIVNKGAEITASQMVGNTNRAVEVRKEVRTADLPLAPIRRTALHPAPETLGGPAWAGWAAAAGPLIFAALALGQWIRMAGRRRQALRHRGRALHRALHRLRALPAARAQDVDLCAILRQYLGERLDVPASGLTPAEIGRILSAQGFPAEEGEAFSAFYERHFNAQFSMPTAPLDTRAEVEQARSWLEKIDLGVRQRKTAGRLSRRVGTAVLTLVACASTGMAMTSSEREFVWQEATAVMDSAADTNDWLRAARLYQKLADDGVTGGTVFFNQGTALLKAGRLDAAIALFARAERYEGAASDVQRNLSIALARKTRPASVSWPWSRTLFPWHYDWPCSARAEIALLAFAGLWGVLIVRRFVTCKGTMPFLVVLLVVCVIAGSSVATSWHQELTARPPVSADIRDR